MVDRFPTIPRPPCWLSTSPVESYEEALEPAPLEVQPVPTYQMKFNGAGVGVRRSVLETVGGYAEEFFLYWNEQDLAIRTAGCRSSPSPRPLRMVRRTSRPAWVEIFCSSTESRGWPFSGKSPTT